MFLFATGEYDAREIAEALYDAGASRLVLRQSEDLVWMCDYNCGFTFANPIRHMAVVVIGPTTSGSEFQNTFVHEIHHLAVAIADSLGIDLREEDPAYMAGDAAMELAEVVCKLGCTHCR